VRRLSEGVDPQHSKESRRSAVVARLMAVGPTKVYSGLLFYAQEKGWRSGWAYHAFKEIFHGDPQNQHRRGPAQLQGYLIEEWVVYRKKRPRIKAKSAAPLLAEVEKAVVAIDATGFVAGTLMKPEDFAEDWR
jgi:hypothetical protein